jgi:hypothetical protein
MRRARRRIAARDFSGTGRAKPCQLTEPAAYQLKHQFALARAIVEQPL